MQVASLLIAESLPGPSWPDGIDVAITLGYLSLIFGLPLLAYVLMFLDFRRYLRSLRMAMVLVARGVSRTPRWAMQDRPPCLVALDLHSSCTEEEVMAAYRERVKSLHPDRGGDLNKFLRLQQHFEQALHLVRG
ncbi:MAG: hypothetical protein GXP28_03475 [Planctomycetes bacterium]|nr:hypothetical protein [Planctomycetota bacterium]